MNFIQLWKVNILTGGGFVRLLHIEGNNGIKLHQHGKIDFTQRPIIYTYIILTMNEMIIKTQGQTQR